MPSSLSVIDRVWAGGGTSLTASLSAAERSWLEDVLASNSGFPSLEGMWKLMDEAWSQCGCDPSLVDERLDRFYRHPVWLLNTLFIEQHPESLRNRREFTAWVTAQNPRRIADVGGGGGTLARMIGAALPQARVEVIEPHPHQAMVRRLSPSTNVRFESALAGEYDVLIATDVFEHVADPVDLLVRTARHLRRGGQYLMANCFWPVISCHLRQTLHFRHSWAHVCAALGLVQTEAVSYGHVYRRESEMDCQGARRIEAHSRRWFPLLERVPARLRGRVSRLVFGLVR